MTTVCLLALLPFLSDPFEGEERSLAPASTRALQDDVALSTFDYEYLDAAFVLGDLDGVRVSGSFPVEGPWIALGRFEYLTDDAGPVDIDLVQLSGGAGYVHTVEDGLDVIGSAEIEYGNVEVDTPAGSADDDDFGLRLRAGVRYRVDEKFEVAGGTTIRTIFDEDLGLDSMALYSFTDNLKGFVGFEVQDDTFGIIGVRFGL